MLHTAKRIGRAFVATVARLLLLAVGALVAVAALALGLLLTVSLVTWALSRGRKPVLQAHSFRWRGRAAEVVDVDAHEVRGRPAATPAVLLERER